jgi:uncharacterized protein YjlB
VKIWSRQCRSNAEQQFTSIAIQKREIGLNLFCGLGILEAHEGYGFLTACRKRRRTVPDTPGNDLRSRTMTQPETYRFANDGRFPNSALPLLVYRSAMAPDAGAMEQIFAANEWSNAWRDGIFTYHHFHSIAHEVLGIARGEVQVAFGGPSGQTVTVRAGDVVVIPAGVGHRNMGQTDNLLVVGAYPGGSDYDTLRGRPEEHEKALWAIAAVPLPACDPVSGRDGPLRLLWSKAE